jgi:hypothetical protein
MRSLALAVLLAGISSTAFAADPPNIVGTWVPVSYAGAYIGTGGTAWNYVIDKQDGAAFYGASRSPSGEASVFVGVFSPDGMHFWTSTGRGNHEGEIMGDQLEICWTDNVEKYVGVSCAVYKRQ